MAWNPGMSEGKIPSAALHGRPSVVIHQSDISAILPSKEHDLFATKGCHRVKD